MIRGAVSIGERVSIHERDAIYAVYRADVAAERRRFRLIVVFGILVFALLGYVIGEWVGQDTAYGRAGCAQEVAWLPPPGPKAVPQVPPVLVWKCPAQPSAPDAVP